MRCVAVRAGGLYFGITFCDMMVSACTQYCSRVFVLQIFDQTSDPWHMDLLHNDEVNSLQSILSLVFHWSQTNTRRPSIAYCNVRCAVSYNKCQLTLMDRATPSRPIDHRAAYKAGRWVWSTGDSCRRLLTALGHVELCWQHLTTVGVPWQNFSKSKVARANMGHVSVMFAVYWSVAVDIMDELLFSIFTL